MELHQLAEELRERQICQERWKDVEMSEEDFRNTVLEISDEQMVLTYCACPEVAEITCPGTRGRANGRVSRGVARNNQSNRPKRRIAITPRATKVPIFASKGACAAGPVPREYVHKGGKDRWQHFAMTFLPRQLAENLVVQFSKVSIQNIVCA